jgi:hypothetical protein
MIKVDYPYEYKFHPDQDEAWIAVKDFNVHIHKTDEGVVVDIWGQKRDDAPIASTYAFDAEVIDFHSGPARGEE